MTTNYQPIILATREIGTIWALTTSEPSILASLEAKRPRNSAGIGWKKWAGDYEYIGRFLDYGELRNNLHMLAMRSTTFDFKIVGELNSCIIEADLNSVYVDRLPKLTKHSKKGRNHLKRDLAEDAGEA